MTTVRKTKDAPSSEMPVERLRPGHIVGASGARTIVSDPIDHGTYLAFVVRYANGVQRVENWPAGTRVPVVGRATVSRQTSHLRPVD